MTNEVNVSIIKELVSYMFLHKYCFFLNFYINIVDREEIYTFVVYNIFI